MNFSARVAAGALAGVAATIVMDAVTAIFYTKHIQEREAQLSRHGAAAGVAMKMLDALKLEPTEDDARSAGATLHWVIGVGSGMLAGALSGRDKLPGEASAALTSAAMLAFDEFGLSALGTVPPASQYPWQTNLRSVVGHACYGLALAAGYALLAELVDAKQP